MLIQQGKTGAKERFFVEENGEALAELIYNLPLPNKMIIEHTEVHPRLKGKNVGGQLVRAAVEYARAGGIKVIPLCPFAHAIFRKNPDYGDVLMQQTGI